MEDLFVDVVGKVPSLAVLCFVVVKFLTRIKENRESTERSEILQMKTLKTIGDDCHKVQSRAIDSLDRNTEMLGRTGMILERVESWLDSHE